MTSQRIGRVRALNQRIAGARFSAPEDVVRWMGAIQAQDYEHALWAIALRTVAAQRATVEAAFARGAVVRTWLFRGTLHVVPAADVRWMLALTGPRQTAASAGRRRQLGLDDSDLMRAADVVTSELAGAGPVTRQALLRLLDSQGISPAGQRGYHVLGYLAQSGLICLGPQASREQTFVLLDEWVPAAHPLDREAALAELARRYFASRGPATIRDFAHWSGLTLTDARTAHASIRTELASHGGEDDAVWYSPDLEVRDDDESGSDSNDVAHILPGFDEYLLGYRNRSAVVSAANFQRVVPGANGMFLPITVLDGRVIGTWKRSLPTQRVPSLNLTVSIFAPNLPSLTQVAGAAARYASYLDTPLGNIAITPA